VWLKRAEALGGAFGHISLMSRIEIPATVVSRARPAATYAIGTLAALWLLKRLVRFSTGAALRLLGGIEMTSALKLGLYSLIAGIVACATPSPSIAALKPWNQATVTGLAQKLVPTSEAVWQAMRRQPGDTVGSGEAGANVDLQSKFRTLTEMTQGLAGHLAKGEGLDKTVDMYKSMKELVDDILNDEMFDEMIKPTSDVWATFLVVMKQIAPYYDPKGSSDIQP
jgi:hypothetical protein